MSGGAAAFVATKRGVGARRLAIWICLIGLPLGYEASGLLPGPSRYYGGDAFYWFSGLDVRLALAAIGLAAVLWGLRRSGRSLSSLGWPSRLRLWQAVLGVLVLAGAVALALQHPATISGASAVATASTPKTLLEREWQVGLALIEAPVQEMVWRGALISWLEPSLGTAGAALFAGASYVMMHPTFSVTWQSLLISVIVAGLYSGLYLWRRSLVPSTLLHFLVVAGQLLAPVAA